MNHIFIDGSYFVFYRFHAVLAWWKLRYPETYDTVSLAPIDNPEFVAQFRKLATSSITNIVGCCNKLIGTGTGTEVIIAKDCPRKDIWRMELYADYKGTRSHCDTIGPFFELFYKLFDNNGGYIISYPRLEADDCIALSCMRIRNKGSIDPIFIIGSDNDYLQLLQLPNIYITDLSHMTTKMMTIKRAFTDEEKRGLIRAQGNGKCELLKKILLGDKSDNIRPVFDTTMMRKLTKAHGLQKAADLIPYFNDNPDQLTTDLTQMNKLEEYQLNQQLIDFNFIPRHLSQ